MNRDDATREAAIATAVLAEREACAKVCANMYADLNGDCDCVRTWPQQKMRNDVYANAIRARGIEKGPAEARPSP